MSYTPRIAGLGIALVLVGVLQTGCTSWDRLIPGGRSSWKVGDPGVVLYRSSEGGWFREGQDWRAFIAEFLDDTERYESFESLGSDDDTDQAAVTRQQFENKIRFDMSMIERYQAAYESSLYIRIAQGEFAFDVTQLGLSFATTVVGGESTKAVLGAVSTVVQGAELSLKENFLQDQTSLALVKMMQANRDIAQRTLIEGLSEDRYNSYEDAESDLVAYFVAGSLVSSILALQEQAAEFAEQSAADLSVAKSGDSPLAQLYQAAIAAWVAGDGDDDADRVQTLVEVVGSNPLRRADVFGVGASPIAERQLALEYVYSKQRSVQDLRAITGSLGIPVDLNQPEVNTEERSEDSTDDGAERSDESSADDGTEDGAVTTDTDPAEPEPANPPAAQDE